MNIFKISVSVLGSLIILSCSEAAKELSKQTPIIDSIAPTVKTTIPANASNTVQISSDLRVVFSESMDATSLNPGNVKVFRLNADDTTTNIPLASGDVGLAYDDKELSLRVKTAEDLEYRVQYRVELFADHVNQLGIKDVSGNLLVTDSNSDIYSWKFTTDSPYTVGGVISGVQGTIVLQNNKGDGLTLTRDGPFTFSEPLPDNAVYNVEIVSKNSDLNCILSGTSGIIAGEMVTDLDISCGAQAEPDMKFGDKGIVKAIVGNDLTHIGAMAIQSDGKIVVAGSSSSVTPPVTDLNANINFVVARFNTDGSLDANFGVNGIAVMPYGSGNNYVRSMRIQNDGGIVLAGHSGASLVVVKVDSTGKLIEVKPLSATYGFLYADDAVFHKNSNKLVKVTSAGQNSTGHSMLLVEQFTYSYGGVGTDGHDTTFGPSNNGILYTDVGSTFTTTDYYHVDYPEAVQTQANGNIIVAARSDVVSSPNATTSSNYNAVIMYSSKGTLVNAFSGDGVYSEYLGFHVEELATQQDGKILTIGSSGAMTFMRNESAGARDSGFGAGKLIKVPGFSTGYAVTTQNDGKILGVSGVSAGTGINIQVARLKSDGTLDETFDGDGAKTLFVDGVTVTRNTFTGFNRVINTIAVQKDGKIIVAGGNFDSFVLGRFWP